MSTDRCGYVHDVEGITDLGPVCCWRPARDGGDRCVWHSNEPASREEYERERPRGAERLDGARLSRAPLSNADWLAGCVLVAADFAGATLDRADLGRADLRQATLADVSARNASFGGANLHDASFPYADLRGASFRDARLYRTDFSDVRIDQDTGFDETVVYERPLREDETPGDVEENFTAATWVYRELQRLFEENAMPGRVRAYFLREMDLRRRVAWLRGEYHRAFFLEASRWVMRYGTSPWRILGTSLVLIVLCAAIFPVTGGIREVAGDRTITYQIENPETAARGYQVQVFLKSLYFSVVTFSSLGYGDIQPVGPWARALAGVETLLGTLLMALLIFVLTRRFQ